MKYLFLLIIPFLAITARGQNLVPNGSFEDKSNCIDSVGIKICPPAGWLYVKRKGNSGNVRMQDGIQAPDGDAKLCIIIASKKDQERQYWETTLLQELEKGKRYTLSMQIHGWGEMPNLNDLGIWFVDSLIFSRHDTLLQPRDYIDILQAKVRREKNGWFRIQREIIPDRNVRYMVVGNFSPKDYHLIAQNRYSNSFYICDFVDDIRIEPVVKESCPQCPQLRDSIYLATQKEYFSQPPPARADTPVRAISHKVDTIELPSILFAFNSSKLVDSNGNGLLQYKSIFESKEIQKIVVAGYTDSVGTQEYNKVLAEKRAAEVAKQIVQKFGIAPSIVQTISGGISNKYADINKNRRVEIYVYRK